MSWNPNQGQDPNQPGQYGGYNPPPQPTDPYSQQSGYGQQYGSPQQGQYQQQYGSYQQPQYQQPYTTGSAAATASPLGPSSLNMDPKTAAGLSYLLVGIIFFFIEKQNRFVRFHAAQYILLFITGIAWYILITIISVIIAVAANGSSAAGILLLGPTCLYWIGGLALFIGWLVGMIQAFTGKYFKLPVIGNIAEKWAGAGLAVAR